jgi:hypothetical protein
MTEEGKEYVEEEEDQQLWCCPFITCSTNLWSHSGDVQRHGHHVCYAHRRQVTQASCGNDSAGSRYDYGSHAVTFRVTRLKVTTRNRFQYESQRPYCSIARPGAICKVMSNSTHPWCSQFMVTAEFWLRGKLVWGHYCELIFACTM